MALVGNGTGRLAGVVDKPTSRAIHADAIDRTTRDPGALERMAHHRGKVVPVRALRPPSVRVDRHQARFAIACTELGVAIARVTEASATRELEHGTLVCCDDAHAEWR